jgi:hypothetical protein
MIRTQMGTYNRSEMVAVKGSLVHQPHKDKGYTRSKAITLISPFSVP